MADGDREYIGGWLAVEHRWLGWDEGIHDAETKIVLCGEIGHIRWLLFQVAWREACKRDFDAALQEMAKRTRIKYVPSSDAEQRTATNETEQLS